MRVFASNRNKFNYIDDFWVYVDSHDREYFLLVKSFNLLIRTKHTRVLIKTIFKKSLSAFLTDFLALRFFLIWKCKLCVKLNN